jgi:hypothetical protein
MQDDMGEYIIYEKFLQTLSSTSTETTSGKKNTRIQDDY